MSPTAAPPVAATTAGPVRRRVRGMVRSAAPLLPIGTYSWLVAGLDGERGMLLELALLGGTLAVVAAAIVLGWWRQDATARRLGGLDQVWAFRRAVRTGVPPGDGTSDESRWRAEADRDLRSAEIEVSVAPFVWVLAVVSGAPVFLARAAGWDAWQFPAYVPVALLVLWPLVWWEAVRRRNRLQRLATRLG